MPSLAYRSMWVFAMFDLPVKTKKDRKEYTRFRKSLLREGFCMLQFSVYARHCSSDDDAEAYARRVCLDLPPRGQVRLLSVTDRQFGKMEVFNGAERGPNEEPPKQLMLF